MHDNIAGLDVALFPNPTDGWFTLSLAETAGRAQARVITVIGDVIEERTLANPTEQFNLNGRPAGIYLLQLTIGSEALTWKIIKRN